MHIGRIKAPAVVCKECGYIHYPDACKICKGTGQAADVINGSYSLVKCRACNGTGIKNDNKTDNKTCQESK